MLALLYPLYFENIKNLTVFNYISEFWKCCLDKQKLNILYISRIHDYLIPFFLYILSFETKSSYASQADLSSKIFHLIFQSARIISNYLNA